MKSKWLNLKNKAIKLRKEGASIKSVEGSFGIPRSTLSGWFKNITLTKDQKDNLNKKRIIALGTAREFAKLTHNKNKKKRIEKSKNDALTTLSKIDTYHKPTIELALAMLYFGEGSKKTLDTNIGNTNPLMLRFFICILKKVYNVNTSKITCHLHLRADQNSKELVSYWSTELRIPESNFRKSIVDKRTTGKVTFPNYKGVCLVRCGNIAIQRKLIYLSRIYCERVINKLGD